MSDKFDFFISYTKTDERWAEWIAWQLEADGYTTKVMAWDFDAGANFPIEMRNAAAQATRTMALLSPAYLQSEFCTAEWAAAFAADPTGGQRLFIPVRVVDCQPDALLKPIVYIDLIGLGETAAHTKLLAGVKLERAKPATKPAFPTSPTTQRAPAFPGAFPVVWTVPFPPNPFFRGRTDLLTDIRAKLHQGRTVAVTQPVAVHGLGGVGKTQLATHYAYTHHSEYAAVLWAVADSPENATTNFAGLVKPLGLPEADAREQAAQVAAVQRWLKEHDRWLLVFDSVDTKQAEAAVLTLLPPAISGHVLITTRRTDWPPTIEEVPVSVMSEDTATTFLRDRTARFQIGRATLRRGRVGATDATERVPPSPGSEADARAVANALGCLPLALEQAAAYIEHHRTTFAAYRKLLDESRAALLNEKIPGATLYPASVAETWLVSERQLTTTARTILRLIGFLAPDDIPRSLFTDDSPVLAEAVRTLKKEAKRAGPAKPPTAETALVELADHSLITLTPAAFTCHRLVQAVQTDRLTAPLRRPWIELALRLVNDAIPSDPAPSDVRSWPVIAPLRGHAETVATHADQLSITDPTARLMNQLGLFLVAKALYREAEPLLRRALAICMASLGQDHPSSQTVAGNYAVLLKALGRTP